MSDSPLPTLDSDSFADDCIAQMSIGLCETKQGAMSNAIFILARPTDTRGDESGAHPGEAFVQLFLSREELTAMLAALNEDWADHLKFTGP